MHGLINYIDTKAKWLHIKKLSCNGTLLQVFIRVYRLEIQSVMLVFSTQLVNFCPLPSLWFNSPPFPVWISILYMYTYRACKGAGLSWASERSTPAAKYLYRSIFLDNDILHWLPWVFSFYAWIYFTSLKTKRLQPLTGGGDQGEW